MSEATTINSETLVPNWAPKGTAHPTPLRLDALVTDEVAAVPMDLPGGKRVWYKRVISPREQAIKRAYEGGFCSVTEEASPLTRDEAEQLAGQLRDNYRNYAVAFNGHVAPTKFIIGSSRDGKGQDRGDIVVQAVQPNVDSFPHALLPQQWNKMENRQIKNFIPYTKTKSLQELQQSSDEKDKELAERLGELKDPLHEFYGAYIESILMGLVPDLKTLRETKTVVGCLFSDNLGVTTDQNGSKQVVMYDFGAPWLDLLPLESRQRLRDLIDQKKKAESPELPILCIQEKRATQYGFDRYITKTEIAPWYTEALAQELQQHAISESKSDVRNFFTSSPDNYLRCLDLMFEREKQGDYEEFLEDRRRRGRREFIGGQPPNDELEFDFGTGMRWGTEHLYYDLGVWWRLTDAPLYATTIFREYDAQGNGKEVTRETPEIYLRFSKNE